MSAKQFSFAAFPQSMQMSRKIWAANFAGPEEPGGPGENLALGLFAQ